jgi:hypothetical protein
MIIALMNGYLRGIEAGKQKRLAVVRRRKTLPDLAPNSSLIFIRIGRTVPPQSVAMQTVIEGKAVKASVALALMPLRR